MLVYVDVCCLNRPFDDQSQERIRLEAEAVLLILERCQSRTWRLVGSEAVDYEIPRIPDKERRHKVFYLASVAQTKQTVTELVQGRAEEFEHLGFKALDALHLACAEAGGADVLLTTDDQFLAKARQHSEVLQVRAENPILWLMEVIENGGSKGNSNAD